MRLISVVVPLKDEAGSLQQLHAELQRASDDLRVAFEVIFIDDGSQDDSWTIIQGLAARDPNVKGIRFRRNFGKAAALSAGFEAATGELVMTLDGDLQDDPREIGRFVAEIDAGHDVVSGWKKIRHDPAHKVWPSRVFNALVSRVSGVRLHDHNCGMKCYRREVLDEVQLYGELHRFVPVLAAAKGWRIGEIAINHRPRESGKSKYGKRRFVRGFLDLFTVMFLTTYAQRPLHILGGMGLVSVAIGAFGMVYLAGYWVLRESIGNATWVPLHQRPAALYSAAALIVGVQLISAGFLAELLTAHSRRANVPYSIAESAGVKPVAPPVDLPLGRAG